MNGDPKGAPPGVKIKLLPRPSGLAWASWLKANPKGAYWENRQLITPRLLLVHTNAASNEGSQASAYNWSMSQPDNAKPHYQVDRDGSATKFLPSDRRGICNASVTADLRTGGRNVALWSLAIETADLGFGAGKPGGACGFTADQGETIAQIIAYEAAMWGFPIDYPSTWDGHGVACHTEPFEYPYWTIYRGKTCPGEQKKIDMKAWIIPRVREILSPPVPPDPNPPQPNPTQGEEEMPFTVRVQNFNAAFLRTGSGDLIWIQAADAQSVFAKYGQPVIVADWASLYKLGQILGENPGEQ